MLVLRCSGSVTGRIDTAPERHQQTVTIKLGLKSNYLSRALNGNSRVMRERVYAAAMAYAAQGRHAGGAL